MTGGAGTAQGRRSLVSERTGVSDRQDGSNAATVGPMAETLPPPETQRWVARRKAQVVTAVREGRLTFDEACRRYGISHQEFLGWERAIEQHGVGALKVTKLREFRRSGETAVMAASETEAGDSLDSR